MTTTPPAGTDLSVGGIEGAPPVRVLRAMGITTLTSVGVLVAHAGSGVLIARLLSPSGKGAATAIMNWTQLVAWVFAIGFPAAVVFLQSRQPSLGPRIVGTSLLATGLFGTVGLIAGELLVTATFAGQPAEVRGLAQVFMLAIFLHILLDMLTSVTSGNHDFTFLNVLRLLQPAAYVALLVGAWAVLDLTVAWVLVAAVAALVLTIVTAMVRIVRRVGLAPPSLSILRGNLGYGLKLQGGMLAGLANHRLDILIMPIYLSTSAIGLYSIAVSVSSMMLSLVGSLSIIVFPVAARAGLERAPQFIARALRITFVFAGGVALALFVSAPWLVRFVYGPEFSGGVTALRILLVGYVCTCGSSIVVAGMKALNKPFAASASQLVAIPITLVGLLLFLEPFGIEGAAAVSSVAYAVGLASALFILCRATGFSLRSLFSIRSLAEDLQVVARRALAAISSRRRASLPG